MALALLRLWPDSVQRVHTTDYATGSFCTLQNRHAAMSKKANLLRNLSAPVIGNTKKFAERYRTSRVQKIVGRVCGLVCPQGSFLKVKLFGKDTLFWNVHFVIEN